MKGLWALILFVWLLPQCVVASRQCVEKKDLRSEWQVFADNQYVSFSEEDVTTLYITVSTRTFKGDFFSLSSEQPVSVFVNGKLLRDLGTTFSFSIDSLSKYAINNTLRFAVHASSGIEVHRLKTTVCTLREVDDEETSFSEQLRSTSFRDFVLIASCFILAIFVTVLQLNPRLSADYFSVTKLLTLRENEEDQSFSRGTSANILIYLFVSLLISLFLMQLVWQGKVMLPWVSLRTFSSSLLSWIFLTLALFAILLVKLFIVYLIASLFRINHLTNYHFFNFVRMLAITVGLMAGAAVVYFIVYGSGKGLYNFLSGAFAWILMLWSVLIFLKLWRKVSFSVFHLFSYICATEVVPILFLLNKLYA